jgi:enamine deaminase RidA (YjgF/YER057c/UK114 family)
MIRKECTDGIGYSVVERGGVRHLFAVATARRGLTLGEQAEEALTAIRAVCHKEGLAGSPVAQSVFLRDLEHQAECRQIVEAFYGQEMPATSYLAQPPVNGAMLAIEAWGLGGGRDKVEITRGDPGLVLASYQGLSWAHLADVRPETATGSTYERSFSTFRTAGQRLQRAGWRFEDVVRTWLYLGHITEPEGASHRYGELNRARTDFYQAMKFGAGLVPGGWTKPVFPASTGIGALGYDVTIHCLALRSDRTDVAIYPLENPRQTAAYDYAHQHGTESPKFARAMVVASPELITTFVSGTASITASETRHQNDFAQQAHQTLDNIESLVASANFRSHGLTFRGATLADLALARVYIKRPEDYQAAQAICRSRLGDLPTLYVIGDICRAELLVEIEAVAFSCRQG